MSKSALKRILSEAPDAPEAGHPEYEPDVEAMFLEQPDDEVRAELAEQVDRAFDLYQKLKQANVLQVCRDPVRAAVNFRVSERDTVLAVLKLAVEQAETPGSDRVYKRIKRHARYIL